MNFSLSTVLSNVVEGFVSISIVSQGNNAIFIVLMILQLENIIRLANIDDS